MKLSQFSLKTNYLNQFISKLEYNLWKKNIMIHYEFDENMDTSKMKMLSYAI